MYYFELENSEFLYEFGDWKEVSKPPLPIQLFTNAIFTLMESLKVKKLRVIICSFAEPLRTKNMYVVITKDKILEKLFFMSVNSFICPDNLKLEIE